MRFSILSLLIILLISGCTGIKENPEITGEELFQHISYLASDALGGRLPGTEGDLLAARYIADEFKKAGLSYITEDGLQAFEVITNLEKGSENSLYIDSEEFDPDSDFTPLPFSANKSSEAEVVFAGYGFELDNDEVKWNDYEGIDVSGKLVMVLRGNAELDSTVSLFHEYSNEWDKAMVAADQGAEGILFVSGPAMDSEDILLGLDKKEGKVSIPAIHISRTLANQILLSSGKTIKLLEEQLNTQRKPASFNTGTNVKASAEVNPTMTGTYNVVGFLEGSDPEFKDNYIIMGAHYDHLGMGGMGSSSRNQDTVAVHNGADDNASGVAALIEIAEKLAGSENKPSNSFLFIAFGAEEMGLLGSRHYANNPVHTLEDARIMINLDMVGRLRDMQIQVGGVGTAPQSENIVTNLVDPDSLRISTTREGYGASDHTSFYEKDIPVLFVTTGAHTDYHTPEDDTELVNIDGMVRVSGYVFRLAEYIDELEDSLTFQEAGPKVQFTGRRRMKITLGIMPDFTDNDDSQGMRVDQVDPGRPAYLGGMQKGDIIMSIEGDPINGIYDYMYRMGKVSKGQIIVVSVKRDDQTIDLLVQL